MFAVIAINALYASLGHSKVKAPALMKPTWQDEVYKNNHHQYTAAGDRPIDDVGRVALRTRGR